MILPDEIIQIIQNFSGTEDIHLIGFSTGSIPGKHWKIGVDVILQSLDESG